MATTVASARRCCSPVAHTCQPSSRGSRRSSRSPPARSGTRGCLCTLLDCASTVAALCMMCTTAAGVLREWGHGALRLRTTSRCEHPHCPKVRSRRDHSNLRLLFRAIPLALLAHCVPRSVLTVTSRCGGGARGGFGATAYVPAMLTVAIAANKTISAAPACRSSEVSTARTSHACMAHVPLVITVITVDAFPGRRCCLLDVPSSHLCHYGSRRVVCHVATGQKVVSQRRRRVPVGQHGRAAAELSGP